MNNTKDELQEKILQKIKDEKIEPKPLWYFVLKNFSLWAMVFLSVLLASLSIAPIIFIVTNLEYEFLKHLTKNPILFVFSILPYLWIILCILTTYLAKLAWQKTRHGYRFSGRNIIIISIISSLLLGILLNIFNFGKKIDDNMRDPVFGMYKSVENRREENWFHPGEGRVIGRIVETSAEYFKLRNEKNNFEEVIYFDETVPGYEFVEQENRVRVVGFSDNSEQFIACAILPDGFPQNKKRLEEGNKDKNNLRENFEKMKIKLENSSECNEVVKSGRANYLPKPLVPAGQK